MSRVSYTGQLLVATPALRDPNFTRTVVLILDHDGDGALGVVVNRPTELPVTSVLAPWNDLVCEPDVLFQGGPVATDSALALAEVPAEVDAEPLGWRRLYGRLGLVDLDAPPELLAGGVRGMRVFAGYSGWSPGQLEAEVKDGGWYVVESEPGDVFTLDPPGLWRRVLRRQRDELALVATFPDDPLMN
ncbi:YqgE/AlgH family protein [Actinopolymorpha alba]|uniref:YqgE/AlgH family protein n=1 Tax=Actinopolymorpha alba TaxID=533267 RepID=UPI00036BBA7C|nr:YqgE/AlgH family protein [Actinopolymorpha alba]